MHDAIDTSHWHEPQYGVKAGVGDFKRAAMSHDRFMESEAAAALGQNRLLRNLHQKGFAYAWDRIFRKPAD